MNKWVHMNQKSLSQNCLLAQDKFIKLLNVSKTISESMMNDQAQLKIFIELENVLEKVHLER